MPRVAQAHEMHLDMVPIGRPMELISIEEGRPIQRQMRFSKYRRGSEKPRSMRIHRSKAGSLRFFVVELCHGNGASGEKNQGLGAVGIFFELW